MKASTSPEYISNPSLIDQHQPNHHYQQQQQIQQPSNDEETSTYSFRHITKKLQHAKSHGELYQPHAPLPLPPMPKTNSDENEIKHRYKYSPESPQSSMPMRARAATTTAVPIRTRPTLNSTDDTYNSSLANKIPLWKRFKKMIVPTKRSKEQQQHNSLTKIPIFQSNESSSNETSRTYHEISIEVFFT
jgi:hypothetical protein